MKKIFMLPLLVIVLATSCKEPAVPYLSLPNILIVEGNSEQCYMYERPDRKSPMLFEEEELAGDPEYMWGFGSLSRGGINVAIFDEGILLEEVDNFYRVLYKDEVGIVYVPKNKASIAQIVPLTFQNVPSFNSGDYEGLRVDIYYEGEGYAYEMGVIENGLCVFCYLADGYEIKKMGISIDDMDDGIFDEESPNKLSNKEKKSLVSKFLQNGLSSNITIQYISHQGMGFITIKKEQLMEYGLAEIKQWTKSTAQEIAERK